METSKTYNYSPPVDQLLTYGEPGPEKVKDWPDYLQLGLGSEHISELIRMATDQSLIESEEEEEEGDVIWGPVHAWRALGQLHAEAAIEPLLSIFQTQADNDWVMEELPDVFGMIGPAALPALTAFLADSSNGEWPRINASSSIEKVGIHSPEACSACIEILSKQLETLLEKENFEEDDDEISGFLVSSLAELGAKEAAPLIERAFNAERIDESMISWKDVQYKLGLLSPEETAKMHAERLSMRLYGSTMPDVEFPVGKAPGRGEAHKKAKHKSKVAKQSRKKNRKR